MKAMRLIRCFPRFSSSLSSMPAPTNTVPLRFQADTAAPLVRLEVKKHFDALTPKEKLYAHHVAQASWAGAGIIAASMTPHGPALTSMFLDIFTHKPTRGSASPKPADMAALKVKSGASDKQWELFLEYAGQVLYNLGNYRSFGDTKFIPRLSKDEFESIIRHIGTSVTQQQFAQLSSTIFDVAPEAHLLIGYTADGHTSGYYGAGVSKADVDFVQAELVKRGAWFALNTRIFKPDASTFEVRVASADASKPVESIVVGGKTIRIVYGDFQLEMAAVTEAMARAAPFAANDHQRKMVDSYVKSFKTGSMDDHVDSQKHWIRDIGPVVETNVGFIETYRDPAGVRAEWEGFVAVVNKEMTEKFQKLVDGAPKFLALLPWGPDFEKDKFNKPDFTSLEVLSFATTGMPPAGINIPNYDDVRMTFGFKNVSLGNIVGAKTPMTEKVTFIRDEDQELYKKLQSEAFEVQVGLHELLGHGSGKLLSEDTPGVFNFDIKNPPVSPVTKKPITTWYKPGETWGSLFKASASTMEECRAEAVAMYLCVHESVLEIFGLHNKQEQDDIIYICYLNMARAGLTSLLFFDPQSRKWGQAHMQARYAILQVFIQAGIVRVEHDATAENLTIHLDRNKIKTDGIKAVGEFLCKLALYKATADAVNGLQWYDQMTSVPESWFKFRDIVIAKKQPGKVFVQGNTLLTANGSVELKEYPLTLEGLIESYVERAMPNL
eukprot:jgi/Hompol1/6871/HPOL_002358-RA